MQPQLDLQGRPRGSPKSSNSSFDLAKSESSVLTIVSMLSNLLTLKFTNSSTSALHLLPHLAVHPFFVVSFRFCFLLRGYSQVGGAGVVSGAPIPSSSSLPASCDAKALKLF